MIIFNLLSNIFTNAFTEEKLNAVFYSRTNILYTIVTVYVIYSLMYITNIGKGIGIYNGLFNINQVSQIISLFILILTAVILIYNSFYSLNIQSVKGLVNILEYRENIVKESSESYKQLESLEKLENESESETYLIVEYGLIINFIICGALFLMTSGDLISLFISLELQSYGLYILCTIHKDSEQATWGGLMYFLLGGLSSCFVLLGSSLIYINTGTTILDGFYIINNVSSVGYKAIELSLDNVINNMNYIWNENGENYVTALSYNDKFLSYINISLIILVTGFLFKISAAPFHFWSPDVYDAIPTTVTTFVALIAKLSIFVILLELVYYVYGDLSVSDNNNLKIFTWKDCIYLSSMLSLIIGSVLGLTQVRIKRLYAYSTISHVGFILLALCIDRIESISAYLFYIISYTLSNLNAFIILASIGYTMYTCVPKLNNSENTIESQDINVKPNISLNNIKDINVNTTTNGTNNEVIENESVKNRKEKYNTNIEIIFNNLKLKELKYSPIQLITQLKGYFYINPYLAISLAITLFSFMGIPPLIGFFAKQMVLSAALDNGYIFITLIGIITSVIGAGYYLNIIKFMFFYKSDYYILSCFNNTKVFVSLNTPLSVTISILTLILLSFMAIPNETISLTKVLTLLLFI